MSWHNRMNSTKINIYSTDITLTLGSHQWDNFRRFLQVLPTQNKSLNIIDFVLIIITVLVVVFSVLLLLLLLLLLFLLILFPPLIPPWFFVRNVYGFFHSCTMHLDIIKVFYFPNDAQEDCFKRNIKIHIKNAPTCFGFNHHHQGVYYLSLLKLLLYSTYSKLKWYTPWWWWINPKHVGAFLMWILIFLLKQSSCASVGK